MDGIGIGIPKMVSGTHYGNLQKVRGGKRTFGIQEDLLLQSN